MESVPLGTTVIEMKGITKRFPGGVIANDNVNFDVKSGEIHALVGENGAGKTTLMNILYGLIQPDEGEIYVMGKKVELRSPKDAINLGIGMVHQHFTLVSAFNVTENIILGIKSPKEPFLSMGPAEKKIVEISEKYGLRVDPKAKVWQLSVGEKQRVEIVKVLYRGARVLILDEPSAVLTPQEVRELMALITRMARDGLAVIPFITHKLPEVMTQSNRITILRRGKVVATLATSSTNEKDLAKKMVGKEILCSYCKTEPTSSNVVLKVQDLQALNDKEFPALRGVTFCVHEGEILGIAGVAGNGQRELAEVLVGLRKVTGGKVLLKGKEATNCPPREIIDAGVCHVPEDRLQIGLIQDFSVAENLILGETKKSRFVGEHFPLIGRWLLNREEIKRHVETLIESFNIMVPTKDVQVKYLSGGNLQRVLLSRELSKDSQVLVVSQPTRGLDISATEFIHLKLLEQKKGGKAILLISEDLDELMALSDRIAVMYEGRIVGILPISEAKIERIGQMMAGLPVSSD